MSQTRTASITEAVVNTAIGFCIAWIAQMTICWIYRIPLTGQDNAIITFWMTVISVVRSYFVRRAFNSRKAEHQIG